MGDVVPAVGKNTEREGEIFFVDRKPGRLGSDVQSRPAYFGEARLQKGSRGGKRRGNYVRDREPRFLGGPDKFGKRFLKRSYRQDFNFQAFPQDAQRVFYAGFVVNPERERMIFQNFPVDASAAFGPGFGEHPFPVARSNFARTGGNRQARFYLLASEGGRTESEIDLAKGNSGRPLRLAHRLFDPRHQTFSTRNLAAPEAVRQHHRRAQNPQGWIARPHFRRQSLRALAPNVQNFYYVARHFIFKNFAAALSIFSPCSRPFKCRRA